MAASATFVFFFTRLLLLACGHQLRGPTDVEIPDPPMIPAAKHDTQMNTGEKKISALKVKTALAGNTAKAAAAQAASEKLKVEEVYVKTMAVMPELDAVKKSTKKEAARATEASKESQALVKEIEKEKKNIVEKSKLLAVQTVRGMLKQSYSALSKWRKNVLANPWEKGQVAAAKAAAPYFKTMGHFGSTIAAYGLEASMMRSQAAQTGANAKSVAATGKAKRDAGDNIGASQDESMASALAIQSQQLAARAATLEGQATEMRGQMPAFGVQAQTAAWSAEYAANPDGVPPPPVDPNTAFTPPPAKKAAAPL